MKKFNLFKEIITVDKPELLKAINSTKVYGIDIKGNIQYKPFSKDIILIYEGQHTPAPTTALMPSKPQTLGEILGKNYQVVEDDDRVLIKAFANWQALIAVNTPNASYNDTTGDGVDKFADDAIEEIGWQATEFDISYRELVEILESKCDGTLLCIEQEDSTYQFSGLGYLHDNKDAYDVLYSYCKEKITDLITNNPDYTKELLTEDQEEALEYFKCL